MPQRDYQNPGRAIDTATNTVAPTPIPVGNGPSAVGNIPPVQFLAFSATLDIYFGGAPNQDTFNWHSQFTLSSTASNGINPGPFEVRRAASLDVRGLAGRNAVAPRGWRVSSRRRPAIAFTLAISPANGGSI
jgi:hypothetical protein